MPSCMMRGSRVEVTVLNEGEVAFNEAQQIGLAWLKVLNVSQRSWPVSRSLNLMFLKRDRSVRQKPGPRTEPGRLEPTVVCVASGLAKAPTLNQAPKVSGAPVLGSPTRSGRQPTGEAPRKQPVPAGSTQRPALPKFPQLPLPRTGVKGRPVWKVWMPDNCQPPRILPATPCCERNQGSS